jgi:DoxX-like family
MQTITRAVPVSKTNLLAGRLLSGLVVLFLLVDSGMKLAKASASVKGTIELGYQESVVAGIGVLLLACTVLYVIPRTSLLGAILLTGYLGGAVASQVRVGNPLFTHILFPVYFGALLWAGVYLRDDRLRALVSSHNVSSHD